MKPIPYTRKGEWAFLTGIDPREALPIPSKIQHRLKASDCWKVKGSNQLCLRLFPSEDLRYEPQWTGLEMLYEDDFCLVADKPSGMAVHPTDATAGVTLAEAVAAHYESSGQAVAVRYIHRLDADTTGPVLFAKNELSQYVLDAAMREKRIERIYLALVHGRVRNEQGTIRAAIGRDRHHPTRRRVSARGQHAVTHYAVVERLRDMTLMRLRLETGRTHQIRVHLSSIGHPIAGDRLYGGTPMPGLERQALHGERLLFPHPWSNDTVEVHAPLPADLTHLVYSMKL